MQLVPLIFRGQSFSMRR